VRSSGRWEETLWGWGNDLAKSQVGMALDVLWYLLGGHMDLAFFDWNYSGLCCKSKVTISKDLAEVFLYYTLTYVC
jgi:hypothetical protein